MLKQQDGSGSWKCRLAVLSITGILLFNSLPVTVLAVESQADSIDEIDVVEQPIIQDNEQPSEGLEKDSDLMALQEDSADTVETELQYYLSVVADEGGTVRDVSGWYTEGTVIDIEAEPDYPGGYEFDRWRSSSHNTPRFPALASTTFTMADHDVELTATFCETGVQWSHVTLDAGEGGTADGTVDRVPRGDGNYLNKGFQWIYAEPDDGYLFDRWEADGGVIFSDPFSATTCYIVTEPHAAIRASFKKREDNGKHHLKVEVQYANSFYNYQLLGAGYYDAGEEITVDVSAAARRMFTFSGLTTWGDVDIEPDVDEEAMTATFLMPDCDITVLGFFATCPVITLRFLQEKAARSPQGKPASIASRMSLNWRRSHTRGMRSPIGRLRMTWTASRIPVNQWTYLPAQHSIQCRIATPPCGPFSSRWILVAPVRNRTAVRMTVPATTTVVVAAVVIKEAEITAMAVKEAATVTVTAKEIATAERTMEAEAAPGGTPNQPTASRTMVCHSSGE